MRFIIAVFVLCLPVSAVADFSGRVVGVSDGDTMTVLHDGRGEKVRLDGIDCPEKAQPFGQVAKQFTSAQAFGKDVAVQAHGRDKYGRTLAEVRLPDGRSLNQALVGAGLAWAYVKYSSRYVTQEAAARTAKRGLWADPSPIPPWAWRHQPTRRLP